MRLGKLKVYGVGGLPRNVNIDGGVYGIYEYREVINSQGAVLCQEYEKRQGSGTVVVLLNLGFVRSNIQNNTDSLVSKAFVS
jgi:hypothetical protein